MVQFCLGLLLIILPFLPLVHWAENPVDLTFAYSGYDWFLGILITAAVSWCLCYVPWTSSIGKRISARLSKISDGVLEIASLIWIGATTMFVANNTFHTRPHLIDAIVQLFQAKIFAEGATSAASPRYIGFFATQHMLFDEGKWYSQYAPGHALFEAIGYIVGSPMYMMIFLALATALLIFRTTRNMYGSQTARITLLMLSMSSFFVFMSASFMNHIPALFFTAVIMYALERLLRTEKGFFALIIGFALGCGFTIRSLDFIATGGAVVVIFLRMYFGKRQFSIQKLASFICFGGIGGIIGSLPYFFYNKVTTGEYLLPGFIKLWGHAHDLGFHATPWGEVHTPLRGILNQLITVNLLNEYLFETTIPVLTLIGIALLFKKLQKEWDANLLIGFFSIPILYVFYWHRDSFLGPRYVYTVLPFILPLLARSIEEIFSFFKNRSLGKAGIIKPVAGTTFFSTLLVAALFYSLGYGAPARESLYRNGMSSMKLDIASIAKQQGISNAIIFIPVSWGGRIISNLRELGVSASVVEKAYRAVDHCELQELLDQGFEGKFTAVQLEAELQKRIDSHEPVQKVRLNDDPTLRLRTDKVITDSCNEQILYDHHWYTNYEPHLLENDPSLQGSLIFARDLRSRNQLLMQEFKGRAGYLFDGNSFVSMK